MSHDAETAYLEAIDVAARRWFDEQARRLLGGEAP